MKLKVNNFVFLIKTLCQALRKFNDKEKFLTSLLKCDMVGMQNHGMMFYLLKFTDL